MRHLVNIRQMWVLLLASALALTLATAVALATTANQETTNGKQITKGGQTTNTDTRNGATTKASAQEPVFDPNNFLSPKEAAADPNPFFPLIPGTKYYYEGESDGEPTSNVVSVTNKTKEILGVTATVVEDLAYEDGELVERTFDWFAQDKDGNVWYLGEASEELDPDTGEVISREGSWEAGVNGAEAGIIMLANPQVGDRYYQEFAQGVAEDQAQVLDLEASLEECVPYGCFDKLLQTKEWTELERGVVEHKYYAAGVGFIYGEMVKGGEEFTQLVKITGPGRN